MRGEIKLFRKWLNAREVGDSKHRNKTYRQRTRRYGDYLYFQDRERFNVEMEQWRLGQHPEQFSSISK